MNIAPRFFDDDLIRFVSNDPFLLFANSFPYVAVSFKDDKRFLKASFVKYFEIKVLKTPSGSGSTISIGLSSVRGGFNRQPGWSNTSFGYHGDDGNYFHASDSGCSYGPPFGKVGDVIGCGVFASRVSGKAKGYLFFTLNGEEVSRKAAHVFDLLADFEPTDEVDKQSQSLAYLYPVVGVDNAGFDFEVNFGWQKPFVFNTEPIDRDCYCRDVRALEEFCASMKKEPTFVKSFVRRLAQQTLKLQCPMKYPNPKVFCHYYPKGISLVLILVR